MLSTSDEEVDPSEPGPSSPQRAKQKESKKSKKPSKKKKVTTTTIARKEGAERKKKTVRNSGSVNFVRYSAIVISISQIVIAALHVPGDA